ncbi:hypothetical protein DVK07_02155 [Halorubrum sp. Atlit-26R]|nr:hypothetical protein DVK07_02155 [Halorubrum sp. Atlit-26R]
MPCAERYGVGLKRGSREAGARSLRASLSRSRCSLLRCGAYVACARLAAGALAVFAADLRSVIYKRAAGTSAALSILPLSIVYK